MLRTLQRVQRLVDVVTPFFYSKNLLNYSEILYLLRNPYLF